MDFHLIGQTVQFRFRLGTDDYNNLDYEGWYIDDFRLHTCQLLYRFKTESFVTTQESIIRTYNPLLHL